MAKDDERKRILRMLEDGSISVEECEELLKALSQRRTRKVAREVKAVQGERPAWPYVLLVALALVGVLLWVGLDVGTAWLHWGRGFGVSPLGVPPFHLRGFSLTLPLLAFGGLMRTAALGFWIWMLVDCIARLPCDFRRLFTSRHEYDKWIWIAVVLLTNWVGALVYLVVIRQHGRARTPGTVEQAPSKAKPESAEPFTPSPRARSILPFFLIGFVLAIGGAAVVVLLHPMRFGPHQQWAVMSKVGLIVPFIVTTIWLGVFWVWMLIDCLARDHREFGTLIASDRSADKIVWLLLILFTSVIGALAYHIAIRRRPRPTARTA